MLRQGIEALLMVLAFGIFFGYHYWLIYLRGKSYTQKREFHDYFSAGKVARSIFVETTASDAKEAILAVQQNRNAMTACTFLASITAVLATAGISILLDEGKMSRIRDLSNNDMLLRHATGDLLVPPSAVWCIAFGILFGAFVCFAQSMRLYIHLGFYVRAVPSHFNAGMLTLVEAKSLAVRAGVVFSLGLRLFYLFIVVLMWSAGPSAFLIASVLMTATLHQLDKFDHEAMTDITLEAQSRRAASRELLDPISQSSAPLHQDRQHLGPSPLQRRLSEGSHSTVEMASHV